MLHQGVNVSFSPHVQHEVIHAQEVADGPYVCGSVFKSSLWEHLAWGIQAIIEQQSSTLICSALYGYFFHGLKVGSWGHWGALSPGLSCGRSKKFGLRLFIPGLTVRSRGIWTMTQF